MMDKVFETLFRVNVNDKVEKKAGLSYLSWAYAWGEVKKAFPTATYTIYENADGWCYFTDGKTAWVKTGVTIECLEHIEYLPIMDSRNKSIPVGNITSFDVNKAIQRSLTKACARHGLGLYIYAGEDLPEGEVEKVDENALQNIPKELIDTMERLDIKPSGVATYFHKRVCDLTAENIQEAIATKRKIRAKKVADDE